MTDVLRVETNEPAGSPTAGVERMLLAEGPASSAKRLRGATCGVLAACAGIAAGELVAGLSRRPSPVVAVGDTVIDHVPLGVRELAIEIFGHNDKRALIIGILLVTGLYAAAVGRLAVRRLGVGLCGAAALGLFGLWCATTGRTGEPGNAPPGVVATVIAVSVLFVLVRQLRQSAAVVAPATSSGATGVGGAANEPRRAFLAVSATTAAGAAVAAVGGRALQVDKVANRTRAAIRLPAASGDGSSVSVARPVGATAPVEGMTPFITPNKSFYRIDTALLVPRIDAKTWKLRVSGLVDRELSITYDDLLKRPLVEHDCTIMCVSNEIGGDLIGTARWLGVPLADVLREAGIQPEATQIVGVSDDGWTAGFRTALALDGRKTLIAIGMNGEPLPVAHGFPARLIVPGIYGYVSATKWLTEIRLTRWEDYDGYWVPRGWSKEGPIKTGSRIDVPYNRKSVTAGRTAIAGVAWAQHRGIAKVEVQIDDEPWQVATLAADGGLDTWRQWSLAWQAVKGEHILRVRATDVDGVTQTQERAPVAPDGATGWHSITVDVE